MTNNLLVLEKEIVNSEKPTFMIAGFNQWANAGDVSSGIPEYLIENLQTKRLGHIRKDDFYLFQLPGSHYMFRPPVQYVEGYEEAYHAEPVNDFHYVEIGAKGLIIFIGTEPNQHEDVYVNTFLDAARELHVKRIIVPSGVGFEVPFAKERLISCTYSLKKLRKELDDYAVIFTNYDRNATIGMVINHYSNARGIECIGMTARTPSYQISLPISSDKMAMYDILRRIRYMFGINLDLSSLEKDSKQQVSDFEKTIKKLRMDNPELAPQITIYMEQVEKGFEELTFKEPTAIPEVFLKEFDDTL